LSSGSIAKPELEKRDQATAARLQGTGVVGAPPFDGTWSG